MVDLVLGVLAVLVGAVFCLRGYEAMRVVIPLWGAFAGFLLGAGAVANLTDDGFLASVLGWAVGLGVAVVFGALAYLYYEVSVVLAMAGVGFALGATATTAVGISWTWVAVVVGTLLGIALAVLALVADLPMLVLTVLTAFAGASAVVAGVMLLAGTLNADDLTQETVTQRLTDNTWWYALYLVLALAGVIAQLRAAARTSASVRQAWIADGGRTLR